MNTSVTWGDVEIAALDVIGQIRVDRFHPEVIAAIPRGGWIPAVLFAYLLKVKDIISIEVQKTNGRRQITPLTGMFQGRTVLIVEDLLETGRSLIVARDYLRNLGATTKTASLLITSRSEIIPDYYSRKVDHARFPWEMGPLQTRSDTP